MELVRNCLLELVLDFYPHVEPDEHPCSVPALIPCAHRLDIVARSYYTQPAILNCFRTHNAGCNSQSHLRHILPYSVRHCGESTRAKKENWSGNPGYLSRMVRQRLYSNPLKCSGSHHTSHKSC